MSKKWLRRAGSALACCLILMPATQALCENRALIVGVGDYAYNDNGLRDLPGIELDIEMMKDVADLMGFTSNQVKVLRDSEATSDGIESGISNWLGGAGASDKVLFYYSGHGTVMGDESGDEEDGNDEVILGHTTRVIERNGGMTLEGVVVDDRMNELLGNLRSNDVLVMFDSCHSGSASKSVLLDLQTSNMEIERLESKFFYYPDMPSRGIAVEATSKGEEDDRFVHLGACRDDEESTASSQGSLFTLGVSEAVKKAAADNRPITAMDLKDAAATFITDVAQSSSQIRVYHPQINGNKSLMNKSIFLRNVSNGDGPGWKKLQALYEYVPDKSLYLDLGRQNYRIGDPFEVSVDVPQPGYLYLLYVDATDEITMLYPNKYNPEGRVRAGRVKIPGPNMKFDMTFIEPAGKHKLVALWSGHEMKAFRSGKKSVGDIFATASEKSMNELSKAIRSRAIGVTGRSDAGSSDYKAGQAEFVVH